MYTSMYIGNFFQMCVGLDVVLLFCVKLNIEGGRFRRCHRCCLSLAVCVFIQAYVAVTVI